MPWRLTAERFAGLMADSRVIGIRDVPSAKEILFDPDVKEFILKKIEVVRGMDLTNILGTVRYSEERASPETIWSDCSVDPAISNYFNSAFYNSQPVRLYGLEASDTGDRFARTRIGGRYLRDESFGEFIVLWLTARVLAFMLAYGIEEADIDVEDANSITGDS